MSTNRVWFSLREVIGRQRTRAIGPTCGINSPAAALATADQAQGTPACVVTNRTASAAAPARDWTSTTGRCPIRSARLPQNGAPTALAKERAYAQAPPAP